MVAAASLKSVRLRPKGRGFNWKVSSQGRYNSLLDRGTNQKQQNSIELSSSGGKPKRTVLEKISQRDQLLIKHYMEEEKNS